MTALTATASMRGTKTATASATAGARTPRSFGYLVDHLSNMRTPIKGSLMIIGRDTGLVLDGISRKHCMIRVEDGEFHVADMGSRYGTYLNDEKLAPNAWRPLMPTDQLRLGGAVFHLEIPVRTRDLKAEPSRESTEKLIEANPKAKSRSKRNKKEVVFEGEMASLHDRFRAAAFNGILSAVLGMLFGLLLPKGLAVSTISSFVVMTICTYAPMIYWGQTLGKRFTGLKVVMEDGSPIDWQTVLFRELMMKTGSFFIFAAAMAALAGINQIFFIACFITAPVGFFVKTRMDGMPFWDLICSTRVVPVEEEAEEVGEKTRAPANLELVTESE